MRYLKRFLVKITYFTFKKIAWLGQGLGKILTYFAKPFGFIFQKISRYLVLPLYKAQSFVRRKLLNFYSPAKSKFFVFLTKKYIVHALIVVLTFVVFVGNINAQDIRREDFGEETIIFALFNDQPQYELVEETAVYQPQQKILSYLDKSLQVGEANIVLDNNQITEQQLADSLSTITEGGAAVVKPNITETGFSTATRKKIITHEVKEGETISIIAEKYGISTNTVLWANDLTANSVIKPGMALDILPISGVKHEVKSGDTVKALATKYKVEEEEIVEYNMLGEDKVLAVGQDLIVPGGVKQQVYTTTTQYVTRPSVSIGNLLSQPTTSRGSSTGSGKMLWPTSWRVITQYYHWGHHGLDIDGDYNSPIYAADSGVVEFAGWQNGYGNCYIVNHGNGIKTLYAHLSKLYAVRGQQVVRGDTLGMMGTTGWSTGTHLHFEVQVNGVKKNPLDYIR